MSQGEAPPCCAAVIVRRKKSAVKKKLIMDRTLQKAAMRAGLRLVHMDIEIGVEFYEQTRSHYRKEAKKQTERYDAHPGTGNKIWDTA